MTHHCEKCGCEYHYTLERCPHCAYPGNYANVLVASESGELAAVEWRYEKAVRGAERRQCSQQFAAFTAWLQDSSAVVAPVCGYRSPRVR